MKKVAKKHKKAGAKKNGKSNGNGKNNGKRDVCTLKEDRFCQEYVIDGKKRRAAVAAGFAERSAQVTASQLLKKPRVKKRIAGFQAERQKRTSITQDSLVYEIADAAFKTVDGDGDFRYADKQRALDSLARIMGMFNDNVNMNFRNSDKGTGVSIADLDLSLETKRELLAAIRKAKEGQETLDE